MTKIKNSKYKISFRENTKGERYLEYYIEAAYESKF